MDYIPNHWKFKRNSDFKRSDFKHDYDKRPSFGEALVFATAVLILVLWVCGVFDA